MAGIVFAGIVGNGKFLDVILCGHKELFLVSYCLCLEEWATSREKVVFLITLPWKSNFDAITEVLFYFFGSVVFREHIIGYQVLFLQLNVCIVYF